MFEKMLAKMMKKEDNEVSRDEIADLLKVNPELLDKFEKAYKANSFEDDNDNFFNMSAKEAKELNRKREIGTSSLEETISHIVKELLIDARIINEEIQYLKADKVNSLPEEIRPQLTGNLVKKDIAQPSYLAVLDYYKRWIETGDVNFYHHFRQGLDILDLDPILYEIIGMNRNSMGNWLPTLESSVDKTGFFKYPETKVVKVPLPMLQLTRLDYMAHTPTTLKIVNDFCMKAFDLDVNKKYFVKTGTFSSKFDFRNALVQGEQEVRELGEYLLFIHFQALQMASPLSTPTIYGVSTTNEWIVREFIDDVEDNPTIYQGMPLHTEYRFFVDMDNKEVMGVSPYWREDVMKKSFNSGNSAHKKHDYVIYKVHEETLYKRYNENVDMLTKEVEKLIRHMDLKDQWSLDIMQNGDDFYVIDMALAAESALSDVIQDKLVKPKENWIPSLEG